jgi:hypothetical protein
MFTGKQVNYANVTATIAVVLAMSGGAYAAGRYVITSTKQISPKALKELRGKNGPAGPAGSPGANGAPGEKGAPGTNGTNGTNGKDGTSVASAALSSGNAHCKEGGSEFTAAESKKTYACNGSPWAAGGTLPVGAAEVGEWSIADSVTEEEFREAAISFQIPLANALDESHVHFIAPKETLPTGCTGSVEKPEAASGNLCVFAAEGMSQVFPALEVPPIQDVSSGRGADKMGTRLVLGAVKTGLFLAHGSWAVTG